MNVASVGHVHITHFLAIILVPKNKVGRDDAVFEDVLFVIDVVQKSVESGNALFDPGLDCIPVAR